MHRVLFAIPLGGGMPIFGYGLFLMLGFVVGLSVAWLRSRKAGISRDAILDIGIISIFAGVVGARIAYLLIDYEPVPGDSWGEWLAVWQGGLTFQGGLFLALAADYIYLRWKRISVWKMFDVYAPSLALGVGFGRIGCLLNGCCWGKIAEAGSWWGMRFPDYIEPMAAQRYLHAHNHEAWEALVQSLGYPAGTLPTIPVYATQIVSAIGLFLIASGLVWAEKRFPKRQDGQVIVWFLFAYAIGRFIIEYWRDDTPLRYGFGAFPGLRLGQWLAVAMVVLGIVFQLILNRKSRREAAGV
ncbi:MAG: prolipoprotein diacylglyceryl transferase [Planctomycetaceae bacterium]|nr:prolipoprotein diacylglyceryl transferase [Planctomycetaceae bacterium]